MNLKKVLIGIFWCGVIVAPILIAYATISQLPPDIEIPLHWNAQHKIDRYGSPWEIFPGSFLAAGCNLLIMLCYVFTDKLFGLNLVHGVSRKAARPFFCSIATILLITWIGVLAVWIYQIKQAGF